MKVWNFRDMIVAEEHQELLAFARSVAQFRDLKSLSSIVFDYLVIFLAIDVSLRFHQGFVGGLFYILALVIIAGRQHGLMILVHEGVHGLLFCDHRINDLASDLFCILPFGSSFRSYRNNHLAHHAHLNTEKDPDWIRKDFGMTWHFPRSLTGLAKFVVIESYPRSFKSKISRLFRLFTGEGLPVSYYLSIISYYILLVAGLWHFGIFKEFFLYWLVPLWLVTPVIFTVRSVAEHFALERSHELNSSRDIEPGFLNQFFFPHNSGLHLTHHLFPFVQAYHLGKVHKKLRQLEVYQQNAQWNDGYFLGRRTLLKEASNRVGKI